MAQNLNERQLATDRTLITVNDKKVNLNPNVKSGTLQYVMKAPDDSITNELYLTIPESLNEGKYYKVLMLDEDGVFTEDNVGFRDFSVTGNATITGDMTVTGTITSTHTEDLNVTSNFILLNEGGIAGGGTGIASGTAGVQIDRGDDLLADGYIRFRESMNSVVSSSPTKGYDFSIGSNVLLTLDENKKLEVPTLEVSDLKAVNIDITNATIENLNGQLINKDLAFKDHLHYIDASSEPDNATSYNGMIWHNSINGFDYIKLNDEFKKIATDANGPTLQIVPFEITVSSNSTEEIIPGFDSTKDDLMAYLDSDYMHKGTDFSLSTDKIIKTAGTFTSGQKIRGLIYKNVKIYVPALTEEPLTIRTSTEFDTAGLITKNVYKRKSDNTLYKEVEATNPNVNGRYQTIIEKTYTPSETLEKTVTYTLAYSSDGLCISNDGGVIS